MNGGQTVLARIDDDLQKLEVASVEAQLTQAKAGVTEAEAEVDQSRRNYEYLKELGEKGIAPAKEVRDAADAQTSALARLEKARADVLVVQARLNLAQELLDRSLVLAPFDGVIVSAK